MISLKVLFVEDDPADQVAFERFVEEHGLPITYSLAGSLSEAKGLVGQENFDVIVADYSLGDGTSLDLLPFAAGIPVILLTGVGDDETAARAFTAGISDSLVKDVGRNYLERLPERMEKAVGQQLRSGETLRESEALYHRVVETANEGIWIADLDYRTSFVNRRMAEMLGYQPEEMTGQPIQQFLFPEDLADFADRTRAKGRTAPAQYERRFRHKDGSARQTIISTTSTVDEGEEFRGSFAMVTDITERKKVEEALQESEAKYRLLADNTVDGVWLLDMNLKLIYCSPSSEKQSGFTSQEIMEMSLEQYFTPESLNVVAKAFLEEMPKVEADPNYNPIITLDLEFCKKDGTAFWAESKFRIVRDKHGKPVSIMAQARDITERKELEERIRQVRSDLLFAVSHDLKTPLQVLNQSQEMLNELTPGEGLARFQEYQQIWRRNLQRLERMINNLVDSQRGEEDRFPILLAPCRLEEIVQRVVEDLTGYALALQVQFNLQLEPVPESACDEEAIARMVENLLTNAVKFSAKGGRVEIRLRMEDQTLRLEVEDHGLGIPANEQEQLFQPFQRGSAQRKGVPGTGLGLYICRRIMEAHGGSISLQSTEGVGTTVTVTLPLKK